MISFFIGLFIGSIGGFILAALMFMAKDPNDDCPLASAWGLGEANHVQPLLMGVVELRTKGHRVDPPLGCLYIFGGCSLCMGEVLRIPEDYAASRATYLLKDQIGKARVLRGVLTMDGGKAWIKAEVLTPGGLIMEIETEVETKGINPRRRKQEK